MENPPELDVAELDFDFVFSLEDPDSARVRPVGRGRLLLAGGLLALAAATSAGVPAARVSSLREVDEYVLSYQPGTGTSTGVRERSGSTRVWRLKP